MVSPVGLTEHCMVQRQELMEFEAQGRELVAQHWRRRAETIKLMGYQRDPLATLGPWAEAPAETVVQFNNPVGGMILL